jgi:UDPglucose 6-dehydrogenase
MKVAVIGLGFVGLATGLAFAEKGYKVVGHDVDVHRMDILRNGKLPFHEPGLDAALIRHSGRGFLLTDDISEAMHDCDVAFFCVGTPSSDDGAADLTILKSAVESSIRGLPKNRFRVLVVKSTVPPATTSEFVAPLLVSNGWRIGDDIGLANNPEFLREGSAWEDVFASDRIVVGANDERTADILRKLYLPFGAHVDVVSWNTGEFIKYMANTLFATLISFANDASRVAQAIGAIDIKSAFNVFHRDRRWTGNPCNVATHYVYPGCGFGGYCLPKDVAALHAQAMLRGYESPILAATLEVNREIKEHVASKIAARAVKGKPVGILGLSFKPGSDDVRQSPSRDIIIKLLDRGLDVLAFDPLASDAFQKAYPSLQTSSAGSGSIAYADSLDEVVAQAGLLAILVAWPEFRTVLEQQTVPVLDFRYMR